MLDEILLSVYGEEGMKRCNEQIRAYFILKYKNLKAHGQPPPDYALRQYPEILDPDWVEPKVE
jgi:hypothetical protein